MNIESENAIFWKKIIKKYWYFVLVYTIAIIGLIIGIFLVLKGYIESPDIAGGGSWTFNDFSLGTAILWVLFLCLREFLLVFLPFISFCGILTVIIWYKVLTDEEKRALKNMEKKEKHGKKIKKGGSGMSVLFFIAFAIAVYLDGNFWVPAGNLSYSYYIFAWLVGFFWTLIVLGIPILIGGMLYLRKKWKQIPEE